MAQTRETNTFNVENAQSIWQVLTDRVEAFIAAWETSVEPPPLSQFVPLEGTELKHLVLVELIKVDLEQRWQQNHPRRRVEQYLDEFPSLAAGGGVSCDLLYEEFHVRKRAGEDVEPREYFDRFPAQADQLRRLLGLESPELTTSLFRGGKPAQFEVGQSLDDFDLLIRLGQGAFATVFLARQRSLMRLVALKVSANRGMETQTLAQLDHPNIVRVYDQRILADRELRLMYMQYVSGGTLQEVIEAARQLPMADWNGRMLCNLVARALENRGESPPAGSAIRGRLAEASWPEVVCWLGMQLAGALDYAHRQGVLHRDLKPANILLTGDAVPKLVDFNISVCSKLEGASPAAYFGGSLAYMSPEQLEACNPDHPREAESLDGRSDLYSLGIVLWELLAGRRPFHDEPCRLNWSTTLGEMTRRRRAGVDSNLLDRTAARGSPEIQEVLETLLAPETEQRYATAGEAARQLRLCLQPEAQKLLRSAGRGWKRLVLRWSLSVLLLIVILPNAIAGAFNLAYNLEMVKDLPGALPTFWKLQAIINTIAFPGGIAIGAMLIWPVSRAMLPGDRPERGHLDRLPALRHRCLRLGHYAALLGVIEWLVAGVIYPAALRLSGVPLEWTHYFHFFCSLTLSGLIAATFPFFGVTALAVCILYPRLLRPDSAAASDVADLGWLHRMTARYLVLAASLPMLGVTLLVTLGGAQNRLAMGALSAGGLVGFGLVFWLSRCIQSDLATLAEIASLPSDASASGTDSFRARFK